MRLTNISQHLYHYLPFYLLSLVLFVHVVTYTQHISPYKLDETIVTVISRQPLTQLLDTIQAEPHPPGLYLLLHLLPTQDIFLTRMIVVLSSLSLMAGALLYGYKSKVIHSYNLIPGLSLLIASYGFLEITSTVKQESISFPLLTASFLVTLHYFSVPETKRFPLFVILNSLVLLISSFGYINGGFSVIPLIAIFLFSKTSSKHLLISTITFLIGIAYVLLLGFTQVINNSDRFSWIGNNYNSMFQTVSNFLTGNALISMFSDVIVLLLLLAIGILVVTFDKLKSYLKKRYGIFALLISALIITCYFLNLFVRPRYVFPVFSLLVIYAGWGILQLKNYRVVTLAAVGALFVFNSATYFVTAATPTVSQRLAEFIKDQKYSQSTGLLDEHAMYPYIFKINNPEFQTVIPINIFSPNVTIDFSTLSKDQLLSEGKFSDLTNEEYAQLLQKTGMKQFIYKMQNQSRPAYYDPHRKVLDSLTQYCRLSEVYSLSYTDTIFEFSDCSFDK